MEAQTLPKKKTISKGKIKKSIKNVLCRPDPAHWPQLLETDSQQLEASLSVYRVDIPVFKKPHWNELKGIAKENRPKAPSIPKVEGLIFGMSESLNAVQNRSSWAVIIEATVVPRSIMQPTVEACIQASIPVVCLTDLRRISLNIFGIATSCLCIKKEYLPDLRNKILAFSKKYLPSIQEQYKKEQEPMDVEITKDTQNTVKTTSKNEFTYLHRSDKNTRVFLPPDAKICEKNIFSGQNFISFSKKQELNPMGNEFMRMSVKKILGNANRMKRKKK